jgi:hypothetical protein
MQLAARLIVCLLVFCACSRTDIDGFDSVGGSEVLDCSPDGIRICGAGCPSLGDTCLGFGCTAADDIASFVPSTAGVCWADAPDVTATLCGKCTDGDVCIQRGPNQLVCVPESVCFNLWQRGVSDVCRYADLTPYTGSALSSEGGCPFDDGYAPIVCAGSCASCADGAVCEGRSPSHPYGLCRSTNTEDDCDQCMQVPNQNQACAVLNVNVADLPVAKTFGGFCMDRPRCLAVAKALPGGMTCFDASWNILGP